MVDKLLPVAALSLLIVLFSARYWATSLKAVFVLVLLEGALRKWILPGFADLIYFGKDVLLVGVYLGFYLYGPGLRKRSTPPVWMPILGIKLSLLPVLLLSLSPVTGSVIATILGMRGYFFYLPIAFILPYAFPNRQGMIREVAIYTLLAIPVCLLGVAQFRSDGFSVINTYASGISAYGASTFGDGTGTVRVTGTFSYLTGHVVFVCIFIALALAQVVNPQTPYRRTLIYAVIPLLLGNVLMSGSRAAALTCLLTIIGFVANKMGALSSVGRWRAMKVTVGLSLAGTVMLVYGFSNAADKLYARSVGSSDSVQIRLLDMPLEHLSRAWEAGGLTGCGVGVTNPVTIALRNRLGIPEPERLPGAYDMEVGSVFAEIGLTGFFSWYMFRGLVLYSLWLALRRCKDEELRPYLLVTLLVSLPFFLQSLVLNHVACVLFWGLTGLSLTVVRFTCAASQPVSLSNQEGMSTNRRRTRSRATGRELRTA